MLKAHKTYINIDKIKIPKKFTETAPNPYKIIEKTTDYVRDGIISEIYIDKKHNLIDGYISYLIYRTMYFQKIPCIIIREEKTNERNI